MDSDEGETDFLDDEIGEPSYENSVNRFTSRLGSDGDDEFGDDEFGDDEFGDDKTLFTPTAPSMSTTPQATPWTTTTPQATPWTTTTPQATPWTTTTPQPWTTTTPQPWTTTTPQPWTTTTPQPWTTITPQATPSMTTTPQPSIPSRTSGPETVEERKAKATFSKYCRFSDLEQGGDNRTNCLSMSSGLVPIVF